MTIEEKDEIIQKYCCTCGECLIRDICESIEGRFLDHEDSCDKALEIIKNSVATSIDPVNRPAHYTDGKIEVIDYIEDKGLGFCLGNAIKYISRAGKKYKDKEVEDLKKAIWYIERRIKEIEEGLS